MPEPQEVTNAQRRDAKDDVRERLERFEAMPPLQKLRYADLIADEIVGAVLALTVRPA